MYIDDDILSENMENLGVAIVERAAKDYKEALQKKQYTKTKDIEKFFHSPLCNLIMGDSVSPDYILKEIRTQVEEKRSRPINRAKLQEAKRGRERDYRNALKAERNNNG